MEYRGVRIETCEGVYKPCDDTFLLADAMLEEVKSEDHVLDMGTGTGLIAILAASRARKVLAVDVSNSAVECARRNVAANRAANVEVRRSDLFTNVEGKFDLILFNPPYLPREELEPQDELSLAWSGGRDGRRVIDRFIRECRRYLTQGGRVLMVQSSLSSLDRTREMFLKQGFNVSVVAEKGFFFERLYVVKAVLK